MNNILRWGLLGTANINSALIPPLRASNRNQLAAVASRSLDKAEEYARKWRIPAAYGSYEALLNDPTIDVIYISLPNNLHVEWTIKAAAAGKHVLCEKPLALQAEDVDAILVASRKNNVHIAEAFMYRHHAQTLRVKEMIDGGEIGELRSVQGSFSFTLSQPDDYQWRTEQGGGSLWDVGCYPVSYTLLAAGCSPAEVMGWQKKLSPSGSDATFIGQMRFPNGLLAQIHSSFELPLFTRMELRGSEGTILIPTPFTPQRRAHFTLQKEKVQTFLVKGGELYRGEVEDMADVILAGRQPRLPLEESRMIIQSLAALHRSAEINRPVLL